MEQTQTEVHLGGERDYWAQRTAGGALQGAATLL